ncbi:MAG TPA: response regulator transcription factor [Chitinophagaceae bacterium]|nr:response regulator transcription factor [Chitinophagaceae bacterium]
MFRNAVLFLLIFLFSYNIVAAQTKTIERLKHVFAIAPTPAQKLDAALAICEQSHSLSTDTLSRYASLSKALAMQVGDREKEAIANTFIEECLEKLKALRENELPQIIFMDIEMPLINGIDAISIASSKYPGISFIALTVFDDDDKIFEAIRAGACGYLLKHEEHEVLKNAVADVLEHAGAPMSPAIARKTLQLLSKSRQPGKQSAASMPEHLTLREKEILRYVVGGWDAKRISARLDISVLTLRKHIEHMYDKLHVQSKAEIITMTYKNQWVR